MKRVISISLLIYMTVQSIGQFAIIDDADGYTNVRKEPSVSGEIIHKIQYNEVFWYDFSAQDEIQDWILVFVPKDKYCFQSRDDMFLAGWIHRSRLKPLQNLKEATSDEILFEYNLTEFNTDGRIIELHDDKWVKYIDGRPVWGTDGELPETQISGINAVINGVEIEIHSAFYCDLYECDNEFEIFKREGTFFISQGNSDAAGYYELVWVLDDTGILQRFVGRVF